MSKASVRPFDIFAHLAASGSASRSAAELALPIDDIEAAIESLEIRLGCHLFDRQGDRRHLTSAGRKAAQAMAMLADEAPDVAPAPAPPAAPSSRRPLTLAAPPAIFGHFQDALAAFEEANDDIAITLDLSVHSAQDAAQVLDAGRADIAYFYALAEPSELPSRYGWSEPINLYAASDHPLARASILSRADIAAAPILAMEPRNPLQALIGNALRKAGIRAVAPPMLATDNLSALLAALRAGEGWFAAFGSMARDIGRTAGVTRLALDLPLPAIEVRQAVASPDRDPAARALADYLFL